MLQLFAQVVNGLLLLQIDALIFTCACFCRLYCLHWLHTLDFCLPFFKQCDTVMQILELPFTSLLECLNVSLSLLLQGIELLFKSNEAVLETLRALSKLSKLVFRELLVS